MEKTIVDNLPSLGKREGSAKFRYTAKSRKALFCDHIFTYSASITALVPDFKLAQQIRPAAKISVSESECDQTLTNWLIASS